MRLSRILLLAAVGGTLVVSSAAQQQSPTYPTSQNQNYPPQQQSQVPPSYPQQGPLYPPSPSQNQSEAQNYPQQQDQNYPAQQGNYPSDSQYPNYPSSQNQEYPPAQSQNPAEQYPPSQQYPSAGQYPPAQQYPPQEQEPYPPAQNYPQEQYPQTGSQYPSYPPPQGTYPPPPVQQREWVPQGVEALGQYASQRTEFTVDHSMLVMASKMDRDNEDLRRVIAGVNGVSVHSFHFPGRVTCDPRVMSSISQQYHEAGWQHLVSKHRREYGGLGTDLWLKLDRGAITDIAVLFVGEQQLNFVSVAGSISPLDLLHLSGHFGIPKMDGGVAVRAPYEERHKDKDWDRDRYQNEYH